MQTVDLATIKSEYPAKLHPLFELGRESLYMKPDRSFYDKFDFKEEDTTPLIELALTDKYDYIDYEENKIEHEKCHAASIHAIYIMGMLNVDYIIDNLYEKMEYVDGNDDFFNDALIAYFGLIGEEAIAPMEEYIFKNAGYYETIILIEGFEAITQNYPNTVERIEAILVRYGQNETTEPSILASAMSLLINLTQAKHIELIREVYTTKDIDEFWQGDLEDIEIELGLRAKRTTTRPKLGFQKILEELGADEYLDSLGGKTVTLPQHSTEPKIGRNDPCLCGSGKKYKKCCMDAS